MAKMFNVNDYVKNLPDSYAKTPSSNNAKILEIEKRAADAIRAAIYEVQASLDLDNAYGKTLDLYGEMLGQKRGIANDSQYRILLKSRIARNLSGGDYNSIAKMLSMVFDCDPREFKLVEKEAAGTVEIQGLPYAAINNSGLSTEDAVKIIYELIPAGVSLESIAFEGTFEFGTAELETDSEKGFGDIEQTTGGYLGFLAGGASSSLPI